MVECIGEGGEQSLWDLTANKEPLSVMGRRDPDAADATQMAALIHDHFGCKCEELEVGERSRWLTRLHHRHLKPFLIMVMVECVNQLRLAQSR